MSKKKNIFFIIFSIYFFFTPFFAFSQTINKIEIKGNDRIPNETILMFSDVNIGENIDDCSDLWVLVHDAARPCLKSNEIKLFINETISIFLSVVVLNLIAKS